jgi:sodium/proline symporter
MNSNAIIGVTFMAYLATICWLGWLAYRRTYNAADYFLGGRQLSPWVAALSAGASDTSGWLLIGLPGFAYAAGLEALWLALGLVLGTGACWMTMAKRLRLYSEQCGDALTLPVYLHRRFHCTHAGLRSVAAIFILLFFLFYVSSGLIAGAKLFNTVFEIPYHWALLMGLAAIISYTLFGGFLAVSWTDVLQGLLITLALIAVPTMVFFSLPGKAGELVMQRNPAALSAWTNSGGQALGLIAILSSLGWGLGYFGQPHILARYKAIRSAADVPLATTIAVLWSLLVYAGAVAVGILGIAFIASPLPDSEQVFMVAVQTLFSPWVAGVLLAAILAAIMSTADSQLLVCSSAFTEDIYRGFLPGLSPEQAVQIGRIAVAVIAVLAAGIATNAESKVLDVVAYAWAGLGAALGPALLLSLYWRRMNGSGALAGVIVGGVTVLVWRQLSGGLFELYELVPGFLFSIIAIVSVSLLTAAPNTEINVEFSTMLSSLEKT